MEGNDYWLFIALVVALALAPAPAYCFSVLYLHSFQSTDGRTLSLDGPTDRPIHRLESVLKAENGGVRGTPPTRILLSSTECLRPVEEDFIVIPGIHVEDAAAWKRRKKGVVRRASCMHIGHGTSG